MAIIRQHGDAATPIGLAGAAGAERGLASAEIRDATGRSDNLFRRDLLDVQMQNAMRLEEERSVNRLREINAQASLARQARAHQSWLASQEADKLAAQRRETLRQDYAGRAALDRGRADIASDARAENLDAQLVALNAETNALMARDAYKAAITEEARNGEMRTLGRIQAGAPPATLSPETQERIQMLEALYDRAGKPKGPTYHAAIGRLAHGVKVPDTWYDELFRGTEFDPFGDREPDAPESFSQEETTYFHLALDDTIGFMEVARIAGEQTTRPRNVSPREFAARPTKSAAQAMRALSQVLKQAPPYQLAAYNARIMEEAADPDTPGVPKVVRQMVNEALYQATRDPQGARGQAIASAAVDQAGANQVVTTVDDLPAQAFPISSDTGQPAMNPQTGEPITMADVRAAAQATGMDVAEFMRRAGLTVGRGGQ